MNFTDAVVIGGTRRTRDGYLVADAKVARTGVQQYAGREVGRPELDTVRVYRPPEEVFSEAAMASVAWRPLTLDHPPEMIDASNWKALSVGITGDTVSRDGDHIRVPLTVMDSAAIDTVAGGKRQLSLGYSCDLDFEPGETPAGEVFDAIQRNIRVNHLAICSAARAGPACRIGDGKPERRQTGKAKPMAKQKIIIVDGEPVETNEAGAEAILALQEALAAANAAVEQLTEALGGKDNELGAKAAEVEKLKEKAVDSAMLDALVADRAAVMAKARAISPGLEPTGRSNGEIRRIAVAARLGDAAVSGRSDDYVLGLFDHLSAGAAAPDPLRRTISAGVRAVDAPYTVQSAHAAMIDHLTSAWMPTKKEAA